MRRGVIRVVVVGIIVLGVAAAVLSWTLPATDQPIAFNHRVHVQDLGADCTDCHLYARTGVRATIPNYQACSVCHEEALGETEAEASLLEHIKAEKPIPWRKVYWVPEHVYFSHRRHTALAGIECEVCHGPIGERDQPVKRRLVEISMDGCLECHEESGASTDCIHCHR